MSAPLAIDLDFLPPGQMIMPRIVGGGVEGGASLSGVTPASDATGGGFVAVDYSSLFIGNSDQSKMRAINRLAVALAGGIRTIVVPLLVDFIQPVPILTGIAGPGGVTTPWSSGAPLPWSTGVTWSTGANWLIRNVGGAVSGAQLANSGTITISLIGGTGALEGGEWFGLSHPTKGLRAYCVTDIDTVAADVHGNPLFTVGIRPTLRESISDASPVEWWRPRCTMRLAPGSSIDINVDKFWFSQPSVKFIEAF